MTKQQLKNKPVRKRKPINWQRVMIVIVFVIYLAAQIYASFKDAKPTSGTITIHELEELVDNGEVDTVAVTSDSNNVSVTLKNGEVKDALNPKNDTFIYDLASKGVNISVQKTSLSDAMTQVILLIPVILIMTMFVLYLSNTLVGGSTKMFTILKHNDNTTTFDDIRGMGKTKKEVQFIIKQMTNWKQLGEMGARPVKGVLLYGPPGTGKTMLAKAIAKESHVAFISASGSDFNEVFVGVGAARVRSLWALAVANAPCILFIDEIDCLGKRRKGGDGASNDHNQTLNALLQRMDGLNVGNGVMVVGATNRKDDLDPALTRPGRFDRELFIGPPDTKKDRDEVVSLYLDNKAKEDDVTVETASKLMVGLTGAEIEEALNSAVFISMQDERNGKISLADIDEAVMQLHTSGVKEEQASQHDLEIAAIHEAGHVIANLYQDYDVSKVSVVPYSSGMGGVTVRDMDKFGDSKLKLKSDYDKDIIVLLAGKVAEELVYGEHTQGCSSDIEKATQVIYSMVTQYGFFDDTLLNQNVLMQNGLKNSVSDRVINVCDEALNEYNSKTRELLSLHLEEIKSLSEQLIEKKTIVNPTIKYLSDITTIKEQGDPELTRIASWLTPRKSKID